MRQTTQPDPTRERLLDEAERLFADKGFAGVSVREITAAAGAHLSAVNYHFGSKHNLYLAVFRERWLPRARRILERLDRLAARGLPRPEDLVRTITEAFFSGFADDAERRRHHQLIHREMCRPGEALSLIVEEVTRPIFDRFRRLLEPHLPPGVDEEEVTLYIFSVICQVLFFNFGRPMVTALTGRTYDEQFRRLLVEHITRFSLRALPRGGEEDS